MSERALHLRNLVREWIVARVDSVALAWLDERASMIQTRDRKTLFLGFGMVPRKVGKADVTLSDAELAQAEAARPGWNPRGWSLDQLARTFLLLSFPSEEAALYVQTLDQLFQAGEVGELVALYQALPLLPNPASHVLRTAEGIRTNIKSVFCAIAHQNPYPAEQLNEEQWNQLVLKCLFIDVPLDQLIGVDTNRVGGPGAAAARFRLRREAGLPLRQAGTGRLDRNTAAPGGDLPLTWRLVSDEDAAPPCPLPFQTVPGSTGGSTARPHARRW